MTTTHTSPSPSPGPHHSGDSPAAPRRIAPLRDFLQNEAAGGILLLAATVAALIWANSPWKAAYHALWDTQFGLSLGRYSFSMDLHHWVNDGLMTIFFFVVGLEIKREVTTGHLSTRQTLTMPLIGALGGMVVPALIYLAIGGGKAANGWGVPMATDIALAVGLLSLMSKRVPTSARVFLLGLAVVDDIGAIIVIAIFYSKGFTLGWFLLAVGSVIAAFLLKRFRVNSIAAYVPFGVLAWFGLHEAGVHATIAGVTMGLLTPLQILGDRNAVDVEEVARDPHVRPDRTVSVLEWLQHVLHPWSSFIVVPLFALANAGLEISIDSVQDALGSRVAWGVFAGLVIGKPIGVLLLVIAAMRARLGELPRGTSRVALWGVGHAAGIGFTVALFISELAFTSEQHRADAKFAILMASLVSALFAVVVLRLVRPQVTAPNQLPDSISGSST